MTYHAGLRSVVATEPTWEAALRNVLGGRGLRLVAQPIIDVAHARVGGYELLARFDGPPARTPDVWFEEARSRDLDAPLTIQVLHRLHEVRTGLPPGTFCTVNVEPHLLARPDVREALLGGGRLDGVVVELTEHVSAGDRVVLSGALDAVREAGGLVAMDDAGQGHSGLARMLEIRPDLVKLDRALISGLDRDPAKRAVVRLVGDLAGQLDAWVLAEGVETRGELAEVIRMGVPLVQGWAVGRPAESWSGLDDDARRFVTDAQERAQFTENVLGLVRPVSVRPPAPRAVADDAGSVVVDDQGRAVAVVVVDLSGGVHEVPAMLVAPSAGPADVLRRAISRPLHLHTAPLVCTDVRGRVLGVLEVRDLVDHVLTRARA